MSEQPIVHIGENSAEEVAFKLYHVVRVAEGPQRIDRKWILDTYAECLRTVQRPQDRR